MRRMYDEKEIKTIAGGGSGTIKLTSGTDIKTFNWATYEDGARFTGSNLKGIPTEITQTKNFVIELHKFDDKAFALTLYHTGLYNEHVGTYIIYHYSDKFQDNWTRIDKQESGGGGLETIWKGSEARHTLTEEEKAKINNHDLLMFSFRDSGSNYYTLISTKQSPCYNTKIMNNGNANKIELAYQAECYYTYLNKTVSGVLTTIYLEIINNNLKLSYTSKDLMLVGIYGL